MLTWYDRWLNFDMHPMEMMVWSEFCWSLLQMSIFYLPCICALCVIIISKVSGSFLLSSLFELLCHCYGRSYSKQTMTALCSLYDEWMDFNMRPMELMVHSEICCSLLENSIFCLLSIHVLRLIISMPVHCFSWILTLIIEDLPSESYWRYVICMTRG
jgi:hypothetical protein